MSNERFVKQQNANTCVCTNVEAETLLRESYDILKQDIHRYERNTWIIEIVIIISNQEKRKTPFTYTIAEHIASVLESQKDWSCVKFSFAPDEICFAVFVNSTDQLRLREDVRMECAKLIEDEFELNPFVYATPFVDSYYGFSIYMNAAEGRHNNPATGEKLYQSNK